MTARRAATSEPPFGPIAGVGSIAAGLVALVYALSFVVLKVDALTAVALLCGGMLTLVAALGLRERLRSSAPRLVELGAILLIAGSLGAAIHGAYDLANVLHPAANGGDLPNAVDPRGFLTFGVSGVGVLVLGATALGTRGLPRLLAWLGIALGALLILVYLGRLIVLDATSPLILVPAALAGFLASPIFYLWLGRELLRSPID